jgi:hypothetical protein
MHLLLHGKDAARFLDTSIHALPPILLPAKP